MDNLLAAWKLIFQQAQRNMPLELLAHHVLCISHVGRLGRLVLWHSSISNLKAHLTSCIKHLLHGLSLVARLVDWKAAVPRLQDSSQGLLIAPGISGQHEHLQ